MWFPSQVRGIDGRCEDVRVTPLKRDPELPQPTTGRPSPMTEFDQFANTSLLQGGGQDPSLYGIFRRQKDVSDLWYLQPNDCS
jgi:hypothetical protein